MNFHDSINFMVMEKSAVSAAIDDLDECGNLGLCPVFRCGEHPGHSALNYVRILLWLPSGYVEGTDSRPVLVIDATSARKLARETRWWGYQYNQIAHALNRIAYYMGRDMADADDVMEQLQIVEEKVEAANADIAALSAEAQRMATMFNVKKWRSRSF